MTSSLAGPLVELMAGRGLTLGCAESLTAGLVSATIADIPGASAVLRGGVTSYATDLKESILGVSAATIRDHGVVSGPCAVEMAVGARRVLGVDWAISTTGVAGPVPQDGVAAGTVVIGVAGADSARSRDLTLAGTRAEVRRATVDEALWLLLESLGIESRRADPGDGDPPASGEIRVKAYGIVRDRSGTMHAVWRGFDQADEPPAFHRLMGGGVEFGERAVDAVVRELHEELGVAFREPRLLGVLESVFRFEGRPGHEVAFVYDGIVDADVAPADGGLFDDQGAPMWVEWRRVDGAGEALAVYPEGVQDLLTPRRE